MEFCVKLLSLPSWERGLKFNYRYMMHKWFYVAPLVGAWIEIKRFSLLRLCQIGSLPSWERGLKSVIGGAAAVVHSRSPRGSVD